MIRLTNLHYFFAIFFIALSTAFCLQAQDTTATEKLNSKKISFGYQMEFGMLVNVEEEYTNTYYYPPNNHIYDFSFHNAFMLKFKNYAGIGIGAGFDLYQTAYILPVYLSLQGKLMPKKKISPILFAQTGYGFYPRKDDPTDPSAQYYYRYTYNGGYHYGYGLGMQIEFKSAASWYMKFGMQGQLYQENEIYVQPEYDQLTERKYDKKRFVIRTGVMF